MSEAIGIAKGIGEWIYNNTFYINIILKKIDIIFYIIINVTYLFCTRFVKH